MPRWAGSGGGSPEADNGLYRSIDGGNTWSKITDSDFASAIFTDFAYDPGSDTMYSVGTNGSGLSTNIYYLDSASKNGANFKKCSTDFDRGLSAPHTLHVSDIVTDPATGKVYLAGEGEIHASTDKCATWVKLVDKGVDAQINVLFFDALLEGGDTGLNEVLEPTCSISAKSFRSGRSARLPKKFTFNMRYSGTAKSGKLQTKTSVARQRWKNGRSFKVKKGRASLIVNMTKPGLVRAYFSNCVTNPITIKKKK